MTEVECPIFILLDFWETHAGSINEKIVEFVIADALNPKTAIGKSHFERKG